MKKCFVECFAVLLFSACTTAPQFAQSSTPANAAKLEKFGSAFSICGLVGQGICQARVHAVDIKWVAQTDSLLLLDPGRHSVLVGCHFANRGSPNGIAVTFQSYNMEFVERTTYKLEAEQVEGRCRTWIVNESDGTIVEGKNVP